MPLLQTRDPTTWNIFLDQNEINWLDESKVKVVTPARRLTLSWTLEDGSSEILAVKIPVSETSYYLVENRQPIGFDKNLARQRDIDHVCR